MNESFWDAQGVEIEACILATKEGANILVCEKTLVSHNPGFALRIRKFKPVLVLTTVFSRPENRGLSLPGSSGGVPGAARDTADTTRGPWRSIRG